MNKHGVFMRMNLRKFEDEVVRELRRAYPKIADEIISLSIVASDDLAVLYADGMDVKAAAAELADNYHNLLDRDEHLYEE